MLSLSDVATKLEVGNQYNIQVLSASASLDEIAHNLVALANGVGGHLLIRVDDKPLTSSVEAKDDAASVAEIIIQKVIEAATLITPLLMIPIPKAHTLDDSIVIVTQVSDGLPGIYAYKGLYLHRDKTGDNQPLHPTSLRHLMLVRGDLRFETTIPRNATLDDIDWDKADAYARLVHTTKAIDTQGLLYQRGCLTKIEGKLYPTYAGILLFGKNPRQYVLGSEVTAVRFAGNTMSDTFTRQDIQGTLIDQVKQVEAFLRDHLRRDIQLTDAMQRDEHYEYPMEATRELIINAIAHRDYSIMGDTIRVSIYGDRFEVSSPGTLAGPMTLANIQHARFSRNPAIVQVLSDMHYIERLGYGVDRVLELMAKQNLIAPIFEEVAGTFRVTLFSKAKQTPTKAEKEEPAGGTVVDTKAQEANLPLIKDGMYRDIAVNTRQEAAITYLHKKQNNRISNSDLKAMFPDVHPETIRRDLVALVNDGVLVKMGQKRGSYYIFAPDNKPEQSE